MSQSLKGLRWSGIVVALTLAFAVLAEEQPISKTAETKAEKVPDAPVVVKKSADWGIYDGKGRDTDGAVRLLRAGELREERRNVGTISHLERNVKIIQDSLTIWCERAIYRRYRGELELMGDVVMIDPQKSLYADRVIYDQNKKTSYARGNVRVLKDSVELRSKYGRFEDAKKEFTFQKKLQITDKERDIIMTGDMGVYNVETEFGQVPLKPLLIHLDSLGVENARIKGDYMEYNSQDGVAFAKDNVKIRWEEVEGTCDELHFFPDDKKALMKGNPRVFRHRDEAVGDSIWLYVTDNMLDSALVMGNAVAYTPSDSMGESPRSSLRGVQIVMDFENGLVDRMQSDGQAIGVYHIFQEGEDQGSNKVSGDQVILFMKDGTLESVVVKGGTEGTFLPPEMAGTVRKIEEKKPDGGAGKK